MAEECSGIRSFLALTITGVLAGHLLLRTGWARGTLALAILPIAIVKNAVRIVVLSLLAIHVDKSFITGSVVHSRGGIPLFFVTLLVVGGVVWLLQRAEAGWAGRRGAGEGGTDPGVSAHGRGAPPGEPGCVRVPYVKRLSQSRESTGHVLMTVPPRDVYNISKTTINQLVDFMRDHGSLVARSSFTAEL